MNICVTPGLAKSEQLSESVMYLVRVGITVLYMNILIHVSKVLSENCHFTAARIAVYCMDVLACGLPVIKSD